MVIPPQKKPLIDPARLRYRANKQLEAPLGKAFLSPRGQSLWVKYLRQSVRGAVPPLKTAVVAHVYYPELLDEIVQCWRAVPCRTDLHITTLPAHQAAIAARFADDPRVAIHSHATGGRDIAPFFALLNAGALSGYDAVLKIHTKRSPQSRIGDIRRRLLFTVLGGHDLQVTRILQQFQRPVAGPETGMVGWGQNFRRDLLYWMGNRDRVNALSARLQFGPQIAPRFFEGSMFWFRPAAFEPLRRLHLGADDFEPETGQLDGALHHALERLFAVSALSAGYVIRSQSGRILCAPERSRARVEV